jgi:hypothetical protein
VPAVGIGGINEKADDLMKTSKIPCAARAALAGPETIVEVWQRTDR